MDFLCLCILQLYWILVLVLTGFDGVFRVFSVWCHVVFVNSVSFISSFLLWMPIISFSCLIALARTYSTMLNKRARVGSLVLFLILEEVFIFWSLIMMFAEGSHMPFIMLRFVPSIPDLLRVLFFFFLIINGCWVLFNAFYAFLEMIISFFILHFVYVIYHIGWFVDFEPSLCLQNNKSHLIMMYDLFNVLLNSVCWYLVEEFCIYVHQGYWPVVLFILFYGVLVWLWYQGIASLIKWVFWMFVEFTSKAIWSKTVCWGFLITDSRKDIQYPY